MLHNPLTEADLQAVVDLVSEANHYPFQVLVNVKDIRGGYASRFFTKAIYIPRWALAKSDDYAIYYAIHELAHIVYGGSGHGVEYKKIEDRLLRHWEMAIRRKKVYPRTIYSRGKVVYASVKKY